jgi:protein TonB
MNASLKTALTYTVAFAVAAIIHVGLFLGTGDLLRSQENRFAELEDSEFEKTLTLTFRRPEPVQLHPKAAVPVTRVRESVPTPADVPEILPRNSEAESPDSKVGEETEEMVQSPAVPQPFRYQSRALPTSRIEKARPLRPIDVEAVYPLGARLRGAEGAVRMIVRIGEDGWVEVVEIGESSGFTILDRAAERAVRRTRFAPATHNGLPITDEITITIRFRLD